MSEDVYKKIFSKNLKKYMQLNGKTQLDLINDLGFNKSAVSTWCNATRLPRMDKVDALATYFNISRSDLIEDNSTRYSNIDCDVNNQEQITIAAHFTGDEYTEDELEEIKKFAEFVKNRRN